MFKKLFAFLFKAKHPRFVRTHDLAKYVMDQISSDMKARFKEEGKIPLLEAEAIGKRAEAIDDRVKVSMRLSPNSVFMARHTVHITGTNQEWFVDNFIDTYKNPNIKEWVLFYSFSIICSSESFLLRVPKCKYEVVSFLFLL